MREPPARIGSGDREQGLGDGFKERLVGTGADAPEYGLQLGERLLNRRQIRRISRQEEELTPLSFDEFSYFISFMNTGIIHNHDLTG